MSKKFFDVEVESVEKTTPECSIISFKIDNGLSDQFKFVQGQYLTLKAHIDGEDVQRSYSLCSAPHDNQWHVAVKKVEDGKFSTYANEVLKPGDVLQVMPPDGRFYVDIDSQLKRNYIAFAAGSGITPVYSIIKTHLEREPDSTFKLFYVNSGVSSIILREEIEALKNRFMNRFEVFHFLTREHRAIDFFNGRLNNEKLQKIFTDICAPSDIDHYFICGPEDMIFVVRDFLLDQGVDKKQLHFELFTSTDSKKQVKREVREELKGLTSAITIQEGGKTFNFNIEQGSKTILEAGIEQGADLPFACKGGVCCTCRAKLIEGKVDMEVNYALEDEEVAAGYVLTCQSIPKSEKVIVDFDL